MGSLALLLAAHVQSSCPDARAQVLDLGIAPSSLPDAEWELVGNPCRERPLLRLIGRQDGTVVRSFTLRPQLALEKPGPVATRDANPGEAVQVEGGWVPWDHLPSPAGAVRATRPIVAGQPLGPLDVERVYDATRGSDVQLVVRRGTLVLTTAGRLLGDASIDTTVRAVNPVTGAVLSGVLVDPHTVEIR